MGDAHQVLRPSAARHTVRYAIAGGRFRQRGFVDPRFDLAGQRLELEAQTAIVIGVEVDVGQQQLVLGRRIFGQQPRKLAQLADEKLGIDLKVLARVRALAPRLSVSDPVDLLPQSHRPVAEQPTEPREPPGLVDIERLAACDLPQAHDVERQRRIVAGSATTVNPQLTEVEQHAEVEMALIDVGPDLTLVRREILRRALRVEHERVRHKIDRREVRLEATAATLREIGVGGKPEHPLDQLRQDRLGQLLLVLTEPRRVEPTYSRRLRAPLSSRYRPAGASRSSAKTANCERIEAAGIRTAQRA